MAASINGRPFKLTYLPLIKYEDIITLGVIGLSLVGYILLIKKFSNKFKERNEFILGNIVFLLFILGLVLTIVLPGGSYLFVFPAYNKYFHDNSSSFNKRIKKRYHIYY